MGARGPKKQPTAKLRIAGSPLAKKRKSRGEPEPPVGRPEPPDWLNAEARKIWSRLAVELETTPGLLTKIDGWAVGLLAQKLADVSKLRKMMNRGHEKFVCEGRQGGTVRNPLAITLRDCERDVLKLLSEFGMTPSARARIEIDFGSGKADDEFEDFLNDRTRPAAG